MAGNAFAQVIGSLQVCDSEEEILEVLSNFINGLTASLQMTRDVQEKTNDANEKYLRSLAHDSDKQLSGAGLCPDTMAGRILQQIERLRDAPDQPTRQQLCAEAQVAVNQLALLLHQLEKEKSDLLQANMTYSSRLSSSIHGPLPVVEEESPMSLDPGYEIVEREHLAGYGLELNNSDPRDCSMMSMSMTNSMAKEELHHKLLDSSKQQPISEEEVRRQHSLEIQEYEEQLRNKDDIIMQLRMQLYEEQHKNREITDGLSALTPGRKMPLPGLGI